MGMETLRIPFLKKGAVEDLGAASFRGSPGWTSLHLLMGPQTGHPLEAL